VPGCQTSTVRDTCGSPEVVVKVRTPERGDAPGFAMTAHVSGWPGDPDDGVALNHGWSDDTLHVVSPPIQHDALSAAADVTVHCRPRPLHTTGLMG